MQTALPRSYPMRRRLIAAVFLVAAGVLLGRAVQLQAVHTDFLRTHGDARALRVVTIPAHRGVITDRNGEPLAISTPVESVWAVPRAVLGKEQDLSGLESLLGFERGSLRDMLRDRLAREFVYLQRHVTPELARRVERLGLEGVHLQREYRRYYPAGEITAHLVGFTNVDDAGQEGIELAFDEWLRGTPGQKRVLKDRLGRVVQDVESIQPARPGHELRLSIDRRLQYLAYRELKLAVARHRAKSGTLVMMDAHTGEVLAMAVQPSYNPNNRTAFKSGTWRNRAVTDVFEPGSTLKPFTVAAALESGMYRPDTIVQTEPGLFRVGSHVIRDIRNFGTLDVTGVIRKSSNVGASKIALALGAEPLWALYSAVGLGRTTGSGFPGEAAGHLQPARNWSELELATASFGYGLSTTTLQLAQAYTVLASDGVLRPVSLQRVTEPPKGEQVMPANVARQVRAMLEEVIGPEGSGKAAAVPGYRVAGKTGTVRKSTAGGYADKRYMSLFAGMAPAREPRVVMVVTIDEPQGDEYYGGQVAAPVFAEVMRGTLRILNVPPDAAGDPDAPVVVAGTVAAP